LNISKFNFSIKLYSNICSKAVLKFSITSTADMDLFFFLKAILEARRTIFPLRAMQFTKSSDETGLMPPVIEIIAAMTPLKTSPIPPHLLGQP
jgi:hypothetical protein